jgi:hypothetical protein
MALPERKSDWNSPTAPVQSIYQMRSTDWNTVVDFLDGTQALPAAAGSAALVTATGTTTARSLGDRFSQLVDPRDFGALYDGAHDDGPALAAAQTLAGATKGIVITGPLRLTSAAGTVSAPLVFLGTGALDLQTGGSATVTGAIIASPARAIFLNNGGTLLFSSKVGILPVKWFGTANDGATDDYWQLIFLINALGSTSCTLSFQATTKIDSALNFPTTMKVRLEGGATFTGAGGITYVGDGDVVVEKTSAQTWTANTAQAITEITFTAASSATYEFQADMLMTAVGSALTFVVLGPASPSQVTLDVVSPSLSIATATAFSSGMAPSGTSAGRYRIRGTFVSAANSGTLQFTVQQASNGPTCTMAKGSTLRWRRLA